MYKRQPFECFRSHVLVTNVYVPPSDNALVAAESTADHVPDLENSSPYSDKIITSDYNDCNLGKSLSRFQQECVLRAGIARLTSSPAMFSTTIHPDPFPPLGRSDHNLVSLVPRYRAHVQREPAVTRNERIFY